MKILAIETSCDETAVAILECQSDKKSATFNVLGNTLLSQVEIHREYGGVFPALAKREHAKNLVPLLEATLEEAELLHEDTQAMTEETRDKIATILSREPGLAELFFEFVNECEPPTLDAIAVTAGPGLEPALWVGVNFAKALSLAWNIPLVAVNHMEGHILSALAEESGPTSYKLQAINLPLLALLISGGHTELVLMKEWLKYELIGQTRDDAVGEAFDKVARMLGLPYPGGPEISRLAESARFDLNSDSQGRTLEFKLPRPMINEASCDFSFAGLKTAVMYLLKKQDVLMNGRSANDKDSMNMHIAREFEDAVAEVLWKKTSRALEQTDAQTLVLGGGVSANTHIRRTFRHFVDTKCPHVALHFPSAALATDNAIMIALAGFYRAKNKEFADLETLKASGNLRLALS